MSRAEQTLEMITRALECAGYEPDGSEAVFAEAHVVRRVLARLAALERTVELAHTALNDAGVNGASRQDDGTTRTLSLEERIALLASGGDEDEEPDQLSPVRTEDILRDLRQGRKVVYFARTRDQVKTMAADLRARVGAYAAVLDFTSERARIISRFRLQLSGAALLTTYDDVATTPLVDPIGVDAVHADDRDGVDSATLSRALAQVVVRK